MRAIRHALFLDPAVPNAPSPIRQPKATGSKQPARNNYPPLPVVTPNPLPPLQVPLSLDDVHTPSDLSALLFTTSCNSSNYAASNFDAVIPPLDGTALFATSCKMNHSCEPNVFVHYRGGYGKGRELVLECVCVRKIEVGEQLTISYVDVGLEVEERQEELRNYGFQCQCARCEAGEGGEEEEEEEEEVRRREAQRERRKRKEGSQNSFPHTCFARPPSSSNTPPPLFHLQNSSEAKVRSIRSVITADYLMPTAISNSTTSSLTTTFVPQSIVDSVVAHVGGDAAGWNLRELKVNGGEAGLALGLAHEGRYKEALDVAPEALGELREFSKRLGN